MKVGDLVELSAKGRALKVCKKFIGLVGIVSGKDSAVFNGNENKVWYYVDWCGGENRVPHLRVDLKYVKR